MNRHPAQGDRGLAVIFVTAHMDVTLECIAIMERNGFRMARPVGKFIVPADAAPDYDPDRPARVELERR